jgi:hypothetical protein
MRPSSPRLFAELTAKLDDMHSIAVEGQSRHNSRVMQRVLACQLRMEIASLDSIVATIKHRIGDHRD